MILYSFSKEDLAWCNVIIVGSIALYFLFFAITQSREIIYSDKLDRKITKDFSVLNIKNIA